LIKASLAAGAAAALPGWIRAADASARPIRFTGSDSLREHAEARGYLFGVAVNTALLDVDGMAAGNVSDTYTQLVRSQANIVVAENAMKWGPLRPTPATYDFVQADRLVRFAGLAGQRIRGHNLCWHEQLPAWFKTTANHDNAAQLLADHIKTVAGRYRGQIHSWDVVNEAVELKDGRADGLRKSPWLELLGPDYIELAFKTAAAADPKAKLTYNDYGIELDTPDDSAKRGQVLLLLRRLKARNVPLHAVGLQSHLQAAGQQPGAGLVEFIRELKKMELEVYVTEMDVNTRGLDSGPDAQDEAVAQVYRSYLGLVLPEPNVKAALTWGISNAHSWLNQTKSEWARRKDGAPQRPLPFDDKFNPTPAFVAVREAIDKARPIVKAATPALAPADVPAYLYKAFAVQGSPAAARPVAARSFAGPQLQ